MEMRQYAALVNATTDMAFICTPDGTPEAAEPGYAAPAGAGTPASATVTLSQLTPAKATKQMEEILAQAVGPGLDG